MKKIYLLLSVFLIAVSAQAQLKNAGMEKWRVYSAGGTTPVNCYVPDSNWYAIDSIIIADGQAFGSSLSIPDTTWKRQVFQDSGANAHGGTYSAKLITKNQSSYLGDFPGILSNAKANIVITAGIPPTVGPITYSGGTPTTQRITSVSAWVKYVPGAAGDSALMTVSTYGTVGTTIDSLLGTGTVKVGPQAAFTQVTANVNYPSISYLVDLVRVTFASSADTANSVVNSTLWVDDVSMVGVAQTSVSVNDVVAGNAVNVYPNPATGVLHIDGQQNETMTCNLVSVSGQVVATQAFTGNGSMDVSALATGLYFYTIVDNAGNVTQRGKVSISK